MADNTLILDIQFKSEDVIKKTADLKNEVAKLKQQNKDLFESEKTISEQYVKTATEIKFLNKEISNNERQLLVQAQAVNANAGSYEQLLRNFQLAEVELKNLSGTLQQNADGTFQVTEAYFQAKKQVEAAKQGILEFNAGILVGNQNVGNYDNTLEGMRTRLSDLQKIIQTTDVNSIQFEEAKSAAENLGLEIGKLEGKLDEFGNKDPKNPAKMTFEDTIATAGAAASAADIVSLAFGDNKNATEALEKAAKSMAVAQNIANIVKERGAIIDTFSLGASKALVISQAAYGVVTTTVTAITAAFGVTAGIAWAIATAGVTLLIAGIVALIVYFDEISTAITDFLGLTSEQERAAEATKQAYEKQTIALAAASEVYNKYNAAVGSAYDRQIKLASAAGKSTIDLENKKAEAFQKSTQQLIEQTQATLQLAKASGASAKEQIDLQNQINDLQGKVLDSQTEVKARQIADEKAKNDKIAEESKKANEKLIADRKKYNDQFKSLQDEFNLSEREKIQKGFDDKISLITGNGEKEIQLRTAIEAKKNEALAKFDEDLQKKENEKLQKATDNANAIALAVLQAEEESQANSLAQFEITFAERQQKLKEQGATEVEIEKIKQAEIQKIKDKFTSEEFSNKISALNAQLKLDQDAIDLSNATEKEKQKQKFDIQIQSLEEQLALTEKYFGSDGVITQAELQGINEIKNAISKARKESTGAENEQKTFGESLGLTDEEVEKAQQAVQAISDGISAVSDIVNARYETQLNQIDNAANAEIVAIQQSQLSEEEKAAKIQQIEKETATKKYEIEKKQFNVNKAMNIAQALVGAAQAIIQSFAQLGPIGGAIAAITVGATTAAQIGLIASQKPPPPPGFAQGVIGLNGAGTSTSDSIPTRLSLGESVITADGTQYAQKNYPGFLEHLNSRHKFATGVIDFGSDATPVTPSESLQALVDAVSQIKPVVAVSDINRKQNDYNQVRTDGTI